MQLKKPKDNAATRVLNAMRDAGFSMTQIALCLGIDNSTLSTWKRGTNGHLGHVPEAHRAKLRELCKQHGVKWRKGDL